VPHHLYEFLDPAQRFSAAAYAVQARAVVANILVRGRLPIVVGGTGFYFKALMGGLSPIPATQPALEAQLAALPTAERYAALQVADPATAARLHPNDTQRTTRALAVFRQTGVPLSQWQQGGQAAPPWPVLKVGLNPPRAQLHENLRRRWEDMLPAAGVVEEARALAARGYTGEEPGLKGLAIPLWLQHARTGTPPLAQVIQKALEADRQYAKRQYTWLNNSFAAQVMLTAPSPQAILPMVQPEF
jgi:tRNA dimethylallyltransferase